MKRSIFLMLAPSITYHYPLALTWLILVNLKQSYSSRTLRACFTLKKSSAPYHITHIICVIRYGAEHFFAKQAFVTQKQQASHLLTSGRYVWFTDSGFVLIIIKQTVFKCLYSLHKLQTLFLSVTSKRTVVGINDISAHGLRQVSWLTLYLTCLFIWLIVNWRFR